MAIKDRFYLILGVICLLVVVGLTGARTYRTVNSLFTSECEFCPIELLRLEITPSQVRVGQLATLSDGLCNNSDTNVNAQLYLGIQSVGSGFTVTNIDLLRKTDERGETVTVTDTEEGRLPRVLEPGCIVTDPVVAPVPVSVTPGMWIIRAHIVAVSPTGEIQTINKTSEPFEVIP